MGMSIRPFTEEGWEDDLLALLASRAPECPRIARDSLWTSVSTGRRGRVLWASGSHCEISYDETNPRARKEHTVEDFLRLYQPV